MLGEKGAWPTFVLYGLVRAAMIAPALYLAGLKGRQLVTASLLSSGAVSLYTLVYTAARGCKPG